MIKEWLEKQKAKAALLQVFKNGEIGISYSYGPNKGMVYPKIRSIKFDYENKAAKFYFSIPTGLDPKDVKKKEYCFKQVFGEHIELKGEVKEFKLTVYTAVLPSVLKYDYEAYRPQLCGGLPIVAGLDINGNIIVYDMVKDPHLLIAGETGSGKSTQLRSVLATLIQALPPERLELYLCDLKRSEFHLFRHIEHVRGLFNSAKEMIPMLLYLQKEMQDRGDLLDQHEVSHIDDLGPDAPPYIVLCIDEVALLQNEKKLMELVEEISAIGRALGVFLILSMQRPDRKVLDGKLKNNLTVRMGFKCADLINSRIVGTPGSEKLKQQGRMLLKLPKFSDPREIQAPYLDLEIAKKILEPYKSIKGNYRKFTPSKASGDALETKEVKENIFEVLDE